MNRSIALIPLAILTNCILLSADAAEVYKWVDAKGVTHYSDEAPVSFTPQVILIKVPTTQSVTVKAENDYYSIANQWQRMHEELLEREKLNLEKTRQKAAQSPQVVYINESTKNRYVVAYPGFFQRRHGPGRYHKKPEHYPARPPAKLPGTGTRSSSAQY